MDALLADLRFALRALRRRPGFAATAILSLSIAIAASTAVFTLVNSALLKDVPGVRRTERLVQIARDVNGEATDVTFQIAQHLGNQRAVLSELAALSLASASIAAGSDPSVRGALAVTASYFDILGVLPARGRTFTPDEATFPSVAPVVLISHDVWQRELSGRSDVIGHTLHVNGTPLLVVGVLPRGFAGHHTGLLVDVFVPLGAAVPGMPSAVALRTPGASSLELLGRLQPGVSLPQAAARLSDAATRHAAQLAETAADANYAVRVDAWGPLPAVVRPSVAIFLGVLLLLVTLALLMACLNVSTVLLARSVERQREMAVRRAIGARRGRLVRQILSEVGVLFGIAGFLGVVTAIWATSLLHNFAPPVPLPGRLGADFGVDWRVLGFAVTLTLGTALAFSLYPALQASGGALAPALRETAASDSRGRARLRAVLVGVQVAVTSLLLSATILFGRALLTMRAIQPSWNPQGVYVTPVNLELNGTPPERGAVVQRELLESTAAQPAVQSAALATKLPLGGRSSFGVVNSPGVEPPAGPRRGFEAALNRVSPGYFATLQIPMFQGRDFDQRDTDGAPLVAVVSTTMARRIWGERNPVGSTFYIGDGAQRQNFTVVGVVADARLTPPGQAPDNFYYVPLAQWYNSDAILHVRARAGQANALPNAVRSAVRAVDSSIPTSAVRPLSDALGVHLLPQRMAASVAGAMGVFGLLLATIGIYGVTAFLVSRRAREFAIRVALGATPRRVLRLVMWHSGRAPLVGMLVGLAGAFGFSRFVGQVVSGVRPGDPAVFVFVPVLLATVAIAAMLVPLRRLGRRSVMTRLRDD